MIGLNRVARFLCCWVSAVAVRTFALVPALIADVFRSIGAAFEWIYDRLEAVGDGLDDEARRS